MKKIISDSIIVDWEKAATRADTVSSHLPEPALYPTNFSFFVFLAGKCPFWLKSQRRAMPKNLPTIRDFQLRLELFVSLKLAN